MADEPKKTKAAAYLAIWHDKKIFLIGRYKWLENYTPWIMPGGGKNKDETTIDCLIREVKEEINFNLYADEDFGTGHVRFFKSFKTEWSDDLNVFESLDGNNIVNHCSIRLDFEKFFGWIWLDTEDQQMMKLFWPQLMPGLKMYLTNKI